MGFITRPGTPREKASRLSQLYKETVWMRYISMFGILIFWFGILPRPVTNVVAVVVIAVTFIPILAAHLLTREKD